MNILILSPEAKYAKPTNNNDSATNLLPFPIINSKITKSLYSLQELIRET